MVKPFVATRSGKTRSTSRAGSSEFLRVSSIPTTIILDKDGKVVNRMNGFLPERFVEMLSARIGDALA